MKKFIRSFLCSLLIALMMFSTMYQPPQESIPTPQPTASEINPCSDEPALDD